MAHSWRCRVCSFPQSGEVLDVTLSSPASHTRSTRLASPSGCPEGAATKPLIFFNLPAEFSNPVVARRLSVPWAENSFFRTHIPSVSRSRGPCPPDTKTIPSAMTCCNLPCVQRVATTIADDIPAIPSGLESCLFLSVGSPRRTRRHPLAQTANSIPSHSEQPVSTRAREVLPRGVSDMVLGL